MANCGWCNNVLVAWSAPLPFVVLCFNFKYTNQLKYQARAPTIWRKNKKKRWRNGKLSHPEYIRTNEMRSEKRSRAPISRRQEKVNWIATQQKTISNLISIDAISLKRTYADSMQNKNKKFFVSEKNKSAKQLQSAHCLSQLPNSRLLE